MAVIASIYNGYSLILRLNNSPESIQGTLRGAFIISTIVLYINYC